MEKNCTLLMLQIHESLCILLLPPSSNFRFPQNIHIPPPSLTSHMMGACECQTFNCSYKLFKWKFYIWESLTNIANIGFCLKLEHNFTWGLLIQKLRKHFIIYCRSLTKVKFSTDQVRPALGSGSWLIDWWIVNHAQKPENGPISDLFNLTQNTFCLYCLILT